MICSPDLSDSGRGIYNIQGPVRRGVCGTGTYLSAIRVLGHPLQLEILTPGVTMPQVTVGPEILWQQQIKNRLCWHRAAYICESFIRSWAGCLLANILRIAGVLNASLTAPRIARRMLPSSLTRVMFPDVIFSRDASNSLHRDTRVRTTLSLGSDKFPAASRT